MDEAKKAELSAAHGRPQQHQRRADVAVVVLCLRGDVDGHNEAGQPEHESLDEVELVNQAKQQYRGDDGACEAEEKEAVVGTETKALPAAPAEAQACNEAGGDGCDRQDKEGDYGGL